MVTNPEAVEVVETNPEAVEVVKTNPEAVEVVEIAGDGEGVTR